MAVTLDEIEGFLKSMGMNYHKDNDRDAIVAMISDEKESASMFIRTPEDGSIFKLQLEPLDADNNNFDIDKDHEHLNIVLQQLLYLNYVYKFGNWEYDFNGGDLRFAVEIILEDALMTEKQFARIIGMLFTSLSDIANIKQMLETGEMPENISNDEAAKLLMKMLKELKSESSNNDEDGI